MVEDQVELAPCEHRVEHDTTFFAENRHRNFWLRRPIPCEHPDGVPGVELKRVIVMVELVDKASRHFKTYGFRRTGFVLDQPVEIPSHRTDEEALNLLKLFTEGDLRASSGRAIN